MSRGKVRTAGDVCADCGAPEPGWASINRGVLICDECCSVHRSLGRHISQVKSLKKGQWCSTQLAMVQHLASHGANNIWEYSLWDPSQKHGRRKPSPREQVHPVKADFIRAKYQFLSFVNKQKDGDINSIDDLSQQLHSCVRTNNLETCLRLISKGADPNYYHPDKGTCPLHVAASSAQILQIELLVIYGADPGAVDAYGKTPIDYARAEGHHDIADRLVECQYELTDRLSYYLCGKKSDHRTGQHFLIPEMADSSLDMSELAKQARKKLQALSNHLFEELAMDVYDEVDRRENDSVWLSTHDHTSIVSDRQAVPFLPVNPEFSATRNQGRQKLARFNAREFATLIIDILSDVKRRQTGVISPVQTKDLSKRESLPATPTVRRALNVSSFTSDDEPLYDSVASDEDYSSVDNLSVKSMKSEDKKMPQQEGQHEEKESTPTPMPTVSENNHTDSVVMEPPTTEHFLEMRRAFIHSQSEVRQLIQANRNLQTEVERLNHMVHALITENSMLKEQQHLMDRGLPNGPDNPQNPTVVQTRTPRQSRPQSMFEPRDHQRVSSRAQKGRSKDDLYPIQSQTQSEDPRATTTSSSTESGSSLSQGSGEFNSMSTYDVPRSVPLDNRTNSAYSIDDVSGHRELSSSPSHRSTIEMEGKEQLPTLEALIGKTEKITKKIQELLVSAQEGKHVCYGPCSEKIHAAVLEMAALFPQKIHSESVKYALHLLTTSADRLKDECAECQPCSSSLDNEEPPFDPALKTQQVIQCAYDIAKSAKQLVTLFQ
ncbi:hypothetical protein ACJMK2_011499 [Sinanodonta woodiana]|uniref:Arf-GAP domain-containing protein n=1 Tax=Sinanodonta woodiana TaxID=1069815 RepID=A0ABD3V592_SINWO